MLDLPGGWESCCEQRIVAQLMRQADAKGMYGPAARAMARASLDFMLSGPRWAEHLPSPRASLVPCPNGWRINDWLIYVLPCADDEALEDVAGLKGSGGQVDLLAPPWTTRLVGHAVRAILPRFPITVYGLDAYVGLRIAFTGLDVRMMGSGASPARGMQALLERYARLVRETPEIGIEFAARAGS